MHSGLDSETFSQMLRVACGSAIDHAAAINVQVILNLPKVMDSLQCMNDPLRASRRAGGSVLLLADGEDVPTRQNIGFTDGIYFEKLTVGDKCHLRISLLILGLELRRPASRTEQ
jgi:hypothetical protein